MSFYNDALQQNNTEIQSNNVDLQGLLDTINALPVAKPEQTKTATPSLSQQTISPDSGKVLSGVTVEPITSTLLTSLDSDFKAENIAEGVEMFGLAGTMVAGGGGVEAETCTVTITDIEGDVNAVEYTGVIDKDLSYNELGDYPAYGTSLVITVVKNTVFIVYERGVGSGVATAGIERMFSASGVEGYLCTGNGSLTYGESEV